MSFPLAGCQTISPFCRPFSPSSSFPTPRRAQIAPVSGGMGRLERLGRGGPPAAPGDPLVGDSGWDTDVTSLPNVAPINPTQQHYPRGVPPSTDPSMVLTFGAYFLKVSPWRLTPTPHASACLGGLCVASSTDPRRQLLGLWLEERRHGRHSLGGEAFLGELVGLTERLGE